VAVVHAAVRAMKDIKRRADFEVYLKKFLASLNLILPHESGHRYRVSARRFGYLLRMVKERYKDGSIDVSDAGAKVKALINEYLVELGIDPKIPPVELLADDFIEHVRRHAGGDDEARASEMEHAIRKHCTVHFDEDPAFYKRMSEKLEELIRRYHDNWEALAESYEELRKEAMEGRRETVEGLDREATVLYDYLVQLAFDGGEAPAESEARAQHLAAEVVSLIRRTINVLDFWQKPIEVKRLRGEIDTAILLTDIPELIERHERLAVEIVKLAEKRHEELVS
jgi:type I restriction enzyme R subunit